MFHWLMILPLLVYSITNASPVNVASNGASECVDALVSVAHHKDADGPLAAATAAAAAAVLVRLCQQLHLTTQ
jgi:hypothetical protein